MTDDVMLLDEVGSGSLIETCTREGAELLAISEEMAAEPCEVD